jgi:hypothetical protein
VVDPQGLIGFIAQNNLTMRGFPMSNLRSGRCVVLFVLTALLAAPAVAEPAVGVGFTVAFGGGQPELGAGVRVFSCDEEDAGALTLGLDYMFRSQTWRGSVGAAYLMDNSYIGVDGGYNFQSGAFDVGIGGGWADTAQTRGRPGMELPPGIPPGIPRIPPGVRE